MCSADRLTAALLVTVCGLTAASCGDPSPSAAPTAPTPPPRQVMLNGTYASDVVDFIVQGKMTWVLSQSGMDVSGVATFTTTAGTTVARGALTGTLAQSTLAFTIAVPRGGVISDPSCTASIEGLAEVTDTTIKGPYAGTASCAGSSQGDLLLTKQ